MEIGSKYGLPGGCFASVTATFSAFSQLRVIRPLSFEGVFDDQRAESQQQQDIPRVLEIANKCGLEILPPPTSFDSTLQG